MQISKRTMGWLGVFALASAATSPLGVVKLVSIFAKIPYYALRSILGFFFPGLFMKSVKNDTVLITGAASGIGRLMALKFAGLGAQKIVLMDMDQKNLEKSEEAVRGACKNPERQEIHSVVANLSTQTAARKAMDESIEKAGDISILINNAGIVTGKKITECPGLICIRSVVAPRY